MMQATAVRKHRAKSNGQVTKPNGVVGELLDRLPPNNPDAERGVLGSVLLDPDKLAEIADIICPDDFYVEAHRKLYGHLYGMHAAGVPIDTLTLVNHLKAAGDFEAVGGAAYVADLAGAVPVAHHAAYYAKLVRDCAVRRTLIHASTEILRDAYAGTDLDSLQNRASDMLASASDDTTRPAIVHASELDGHELRSPVIDGLARRGETLNVVSTSKVGKSWLAYSLLLSIATGRDWLDRFPCTQGRVLLLDNELHLETLARRLAVTAEAMRIPDDEWRPAVDLVALRGRLVDLHGLYSVIKPIPRDSYALVVADSFYRFMPAGVNENSNGEVAQLYNRVDSYAEHLGATWVNIHHTSKGDQSGKSVTDVGAGAGSQSRAADCHLILRPHEQDGVIVLEAVVRSFPPVDAVSLRWNYPLWEIAHDADPRRLRQPQAAKRQADDEIGLAQIVEAIATHGGATVGGLRRWTDISRERLERLLGRLEADGRVTRAEEVVKGNRCCVYHLSVHEATPERAENEQQTLNLS